MYEKGAKGCLKRKNDARLVIDQLHRKVIAKVADLAVGRDEGRQFAVPPQTVACTT